jgi:hypothetical protein
MGFVYEAEDTGPVRRQVASRSWAGLNPDILARFEAERQALAVMNIQAAQVLRRATSAAALRPHTAGHGRRSGVPSPIASPSISACSSTSPCQAVRHARQKA